MPNSIKTLVGVFSLAGCQTPLVLESSDSGAESSAQSAESSHQGGDSSSGSTCAEGFEVLGICYHQTEMSEVKFARHVTAADFDGNQTTDLAMICRGASEAFGICFVSLDGSIISQDIPWLSSGNAQVHAGDFTGDGVSEILVSEMYRFAVFSIEQGVFVQKSGSVYDSGVHDAEDALMFPAMPIDLERNGRSMVVAGAGFFGVRLWKFDDVTASWAPVGQRLGLFGCGDVAEGMVVDLDDDLSPEFLALGSNNNCDSDQSSGSNWNRISVFARKQGSFELEPVWDFAAELPARRFDVADFSNGDDVPDLIVAADEDMMLFIGNGDKTFDPPVPLIGLAHFIGTAPRAADFNGDGIDEVTVEVEEGAYRVLVGLPLPQSTALPPSVRAIRLIQDLNGDGRADIVSLSMSAGHPLVVSLSAS